MPRKEDSQPQPQPQGKSFKPESGKFTSIVVGQSISGRFMNYQQTEITDSRTHQPKNIWVMKLRDTDNPDIVHRIACATMLERAFEDIVDEFGDGDLSQAIQRLRGRRLTINRGPDSRTATTNNQIGNYEIVVWES